MAAFHISSNSIIYFLTFRGTVVQRSFWTVVPYLVYVFIITLIHIYVQKFIVVNNILVVVVGVIISLLLGFRLNNSISRFNEGSSTFTILKQTIRNMALAVWVQVPTYSSQDLIEKKTIINLLDGFCYALKHYIREEYSYDYIDLSMRTKFLPRFVNQVSKVELTNLLPKYDRHVAYDFKPSTNLPQEILYNLSLYSKYVREKNIDMFPFIWTEGFDAGISKLESLVCNLESLQRTPFPVCYASHLEHTFWIYLLALPFEILGSLGWWTIPTIGFAFFFFIGVMSITSEVENLFGYNDNDLPLDDYCLVIRKELMLITATPEPQTVDDWILCSENNPLSPYSSVTGEEWADKSMEEAQQLLFKIRVQTSREEKTRHDWNPDKKKVSPVKKTFENVAADIGETNV